MKIILADISKEMTDAWESHFSAILNGENGIDLQIHNGSLFETPCDALVSPANSFGFMGGGLDGVISNTLGWQIQSRVQDRIRNEFDGELLVGQSLIVKTGHEDFPLLISAPTMRVSMSLASRTKMSANIYLASKAIFLALRKNPQIRSVVIPGLGTGVGGVKPDDCAHKMRLAFNDFYLGQYVFPKTFGDAHDFHDKQTNVLVDITKLPDEF